MSRPSDISQPASGLKRPRNSLFRFLMAPTDSLVTKKQAAAAIDPKQLGAGVIRGIKLREGAVAGKGGLRPEAVLQIVESLQLRDNFGVLNIGDCFVLDVTKVDAVKDFVEDMAKWIAKPKDLPQWLGQDFHVVEVVDRMEDEDGHLVGFECSVLGHLWHTRILKDKPTFIINGEGLDFQVVQLVDPLLADVKANFAEAREELDPDTPESDGCESEDKFVDAKRVRADAGSSTKESKDKETDQPDGKTKFRGLDGIVRLCMDRVNGPKLVSERWSGLYRLLSEEKAGWMLGQGTFTPEEIIDRHKDDYHLMTLDECEEVSDNQWDLVKDMKVVKDASKFKTYMLGMGHIQDRHLICLDDFARNSKCLISLTDEASVDGREELAKTCRSVASFERTFRCWQLAEIWTQLGEKIEASTGNVFKLAEIEPLVAAIELAWFKWQKEVYSLNSTEEVDLRDPQACSMRLAFHFDNLFDLYRKGTSDTIFQWRSFYGAGGYWSGINGRKSDWRPGFATSGHVAPSATPSRSSPCLYYLAGQLGIEDEKGQRFSCVKNVCGRDHVDTASKQVIQTCITNGVMKESLKAGFESFLAGL